jgi:SNF family Na+-dependent transporter
LGWIFDIDKLSEALKKNTGETIPKFFKILVRYVMLGVVALSFLVGFFKELSTNPLELPGWA